MRLSIAKLRPVGVSGVGLCALLLLPCFTHASIVTCRTGTVADAAPVAWTRTGTATPVDDYLRMHREVVAPVLFRNLEPAAPLPPGADQLADQAGRGYRCESFHGARPGGVAGG
jgi:hypothetical protein